MPDSDSDFLPGLKPVIELLETAPERIVKIYVKKDWRVPRTLFDLARKNSASLESVNSGFLDRLCENDPQKRGQVSHQGVVAEISRAHFTPLRELLAIAPDAPLPLILALDEIQDPGNLGSMARAAYALGCAGIIVPKHNSASPGPGAMRSSAGALASLPLCQVVNLARALDEAEETGFAIYGAGMRRGENAFNFEWRLPAILVIGSENKGIRPGVAKRCSQTLFIPFARDFDSLNAAQAASILTAFCAAFHAGNTTI